MMNMARLECQGAWWSLALLRGGIHFVCENWPTRFYRHQSWCQALGYLSTLARAPRIRGAERRTPVALTIPGRTKYNIGLV